MTVMYLFTRYRFNWNEVDYSIFSTYSMLVGLLGTLLSVGVFSHMLKIDDALIGVMSCMSKILAGFIYAYARTNWQIYLDLSLFRPFYQQDDTDKLGTMIGPSEQWNP
ncbi:hypothetical protein J6590_002175 [Homalodisca vitripennis]|nr:hypothetical protein J6590_002175 [Homalodisca vitripennis]